jgi:hypothetical protein
MKPLSALGLALVIVGALVALAVTSLRPVGGAIVLCGAALVVFGFYRPRAARRARSRPPYSWDDPDNAGPRTLYQPNPGEVMVKSRLPEHAPEFTEARPGTIPIPRQQASGGAAEYTASGNADVPEPREREHQAAEYSPNPRVTPDDEVVPQGPQGPNYVPDLLNSEDPNLPPMAPPPPRT